MTRFLTTTALALRHGRSMRTLARWIAHPELAPPGFPRPRKLGGRWMWREEDIGAWEDTATTAVEVA